VDYTLNDAPTKLGLSLVGGGNLIGTGNAGGTSKQNTLTAASNSGDTTLRAGTASTTMIGGSGNNLLDARGSRGTVSIRGGSGSSTMLAANGPATLVGGDKNNSLVAGTTTTRTLGQSLVGGTSTSSLFGNTLVGGRGRDTLRSGAGFNTLISGSGARQSNTLIGGGISNSLAAGQGNDSLTAVSGNSTLLGGAGRTTLQGGVAESNNWLQSRSTGTSGNTLVGGAGSNTLVAGAGIDSIVGGANQNLLLVTQANRNSISNDTIRLSTLTSARNTLGVSLNAGTSLGDTIFSGMASPSQGVKNLRTVQNLSSSSTMITLGGGAQSVGVSTLIAGSGSDTLSVAAFTSTSVLIDASRSVNRVSLVGGGTGNDTFLGSKGGFDTMIGASGNDSFVIQTSALQNTSFGLLNGNRGIDTLFLEAATSISGANFNGVSSIEVLQLGAGNSAIGSLQGSGIQKIIGNTGSDTISANIFGSVKSVALANSSTITLNVPPGSNSTMGFATGQVITGQGIGVGTTITAVRPNPGAKTVILTLSKPTTSLINQGVGITGWLNGATLDGSAALGLPPTDAEKSRAGKAFNDKAASIFAANIGTPFERQKNTLAISTLRNDPDTYVHRKGDYLVSYGQNNLLIGGQGNGLPRIDVGAKGQYLFETDQGEQYQVVDNTLVSGAFANNTLIGGSGENLYLINNRPGATAALPTILNPTSLQSASTIRFTGDGVRLNDTALSSVSARAAQKILTANGNNLITIGQNSAQIGIQTIVGGVGSDTFTAPIDYTPSVYFDASRGSGRQSLAAGVGNDTLLAGSGNATLIGGDGNNSLRGGLGNNLILSGVGDSTLDGGFGISTLQADGGKNRFIVRNYYTRILNPYSLERDSLTGQIEVPNPVPDAITPQVGIVDSYVNFDPIQGSPTQALTGPYQFSPTTPDGSPSITKSPSFASSDLSSFYNLQYFNLLGPANYGVGNALDNTISSASDDALILGMGGNNTLVASGDNSSLYGNITSTYSNPDLYAYAPFDTKTQEFVDGVIGIAGNNSLVANGDNSFLDGGEGYNDGNFGSASNTLIGTADNSTLVQRHQSDVLVSGGAGTVFTSVDLYRLPDNVSDVVVVVTPQATNSGQVTQDGQRMTAGYVAVNDATGGYTETNGAKIGNATEITVDNSIQMQVLYGASEGTTYGSPGVNSDLSLNVGSVIPDPNNPANKKAVTLSWRVPTTPAGDLKSQTLGYLVKYRCLDNQGKALSPWLTYLSGTSQDLTGTSANPRLFVDNLPTSSAGKPVSRYAFQVIAQETVLPAVTDMNPASPTFGQLIARPVSLIGGSRSDVILGDILDTADKSYSNTRAELNNNPVDPEDPGTIETPAPWNPTARFSGLFPTYQDGKGGNDFLISPFINDASGANFTAWQNIGGVPKAVTFSGINTLVGGAGSDTFVVSNGGTDLNVVNGVVQTSAYDQVIKYGLETPAGRNNLVISAVDYLTLSDTNVSQGKFINQAWAAYSDQYVAGNRLDNTLVAFGSGNTLLGAGGRDSLMVADTNTLAGGEYTLIGGTAYGLDSIAGALNDFKAVSLGGNGYRASTYRDYDPVPVNANGPGTADPSQYWMVNGPFGPVYDPLRNSDTLVANYGSSLSSALLDGGAGNDSMVGGTGDDTLFVSRGSSSSATSISGSDVVIGKGGNDWIMFTGSDTYWSGRTGATTDILGYVLSTNGDAAEGQSISNIKLQDGSPVARFATGNATSTGINREIDGFIDEKGSNQIIGNEQNNTLNGGGVGGTNGKGVGVDTLTGGAGADLFVIGAQYRGSAYNQRATTSSAGDFAVVDEYRTDADYAVITDFSQVDTLQLSGSAADYFIGEAPTGFTQYNIGGGAPITTASTDFGIYATTAAGPNLVAQIKGIALGGGLTTATVGGVPVDGLGSTIADPNHLGGDSISAGSVNQLNYLGVGAMYNLQGSNFASRVTFA
jgi:Ca2+-binding RTX toxin-like protein